MSLSEIRDHAAAIVDLVDSMHVPVEPTEPPAPEPPPVAILDVESLIDARFAASDYVLHADARPGWIAHFTAARDRGASEADLVAEMDAIIIRDGGLGMLQKKPGATPSPGPVPAPGPLPSSDVIETMIRDMADASDAEPANDSNSWLRRAYVMMGNKPIASNTADWFSGGRHLFPGWWQSIIAWLVLAEAVGNAGAPRLNLRRLRLWLMMQDAWTQIIDADKFGGHRQRQNGNYYGGSMTPDWRTEDDGSVSMSLIAGLNWHGYSGVAKLPDPSAIQAVHAKIDGRLIGDPDEIARSRWMLDCAADYYPNGAAPDVVAPAVAISRGRLLTDEWQTISMTTFSDAGVQDPGGGITTADFRSNPPPL